MLAQNSSLPNTHYQHDGVGARFRSEMRADRLTLLNSGRHWHRMHETLEIGIPEPDQFLVRAGIKRDLFVLA